MAIVSRQRRRTRRVVKKGSKNTLDILGLHGWHVTSVDDTVPGRYTISVVLDDPQPQQCYKTADCENAEPPLKFGYRTIQVRDLPMHGRFVYLSVKRQRFRCRCCNAVKDCSLDNCYGNREPSQRRQHRLTRRLFEYILGQSARLSFADIAASVGLSDVTVGRILKSQRPFVSARTSIRAPRVLGIDDKLIGKKWYTVFADIEKRVLLDVYEGRKFDEDGLHSFFGRMEGSHDQIEVVCQDMSMSYRNFIRRNLPGVKVVVDKFHVLMKSNNAVDKVRASVKRHRMSTNKQRWEFSQVRLAFLSKHSKKVRPLLKRWLSAYPELKAVYDAKERFYGFYSQKTRSAAETFYISWVSKLDSSARPYFKNLLSCMDGEFKEEIYNYFDEPFTNGFVEALNGRIEQMVSVGRNITYETLRQRMLLSYGADRAASAQFRRKQRSDVATGPGQIGDDQPEKSVSRIQSVRRRRREPVVSGPPLTGAVQGEFDLGIGYVGERRLT